MARIQILELPEGASDERSPFAVIIDQVQDVDALRTSLGLDSSVRDAMGARVILAFEETVDIPANEPAYATELTGEGDSVTAGVVHLKVEPDLTGFDESLGAALAGAQRIARTYADREVRKYNDGAALGALAADREPPAYAAGGTIRSQPSVGLTSEQLRSRATQAAGEPAPECP
jgi:hypothetical protein